jgi:hypothetical protein
MSAASGALIAQNTLHANSVVGDGIPAAERAVAAALAPSASSAV